MAGFARITTDPAQMAGVPCIRGLRFPAASVVAMVADGMTEDEILAEHPDLERDDIRGGVALGRAGGAGASTAVAAPGVRLLLDEDRIRVRTLSLRPR
jgi:uncharacterized protein (DUF433 family)